MSSVNYNTTNHKEGNTIMAKSTKSADTSVSNVLITEELLPIYQQYVAAQNAKSAAEKIEKAGGKAEVI